MTRADRLRRHVLEKRVLRGMLPIRAATLAHRSAQPEARAREERFAAASRAYVDALAAAAAPPPANMRRVTVDSLAWWAPLVRPDDQAAVDRYLAQQDFPYRTIAQTREVAIGTTMIDIGGNTGRMSVPRVVLGDVAAAYCVEPDALNYACLVRNVRDNHLLGLVMPDRVALGSENGVARLERKTAGGHSIIDAGTASTREIAEVPQLTLDTWVERVGIDLQALAFVKVDVQGSEVHVLRGASRVLACRHVAWQIEVDLSLLRRRGHAGADLFAILQRHFTHFTDLSREARGARVRAIDELEAALAYLEGARHGGTDVLVYTLAGETGEAPPQGAPSGST
jgi:FkbM family methyltransferase